MIDVKNYDYEYLFFVDGFSLLLHHTEWLSQILQQPLFHRVRGQGKLAQSD